MHRFILCLNQSKLYDDPVGLEPSLSFEVVYGFICDRRRVAVPRYRMISLVLLKLQCMIQLSIWIDCHVVPQTYIGIDMDIIYLLMSAVRTIRWHSRLERQFSKREVVGLSPAVNNIFFSFCYSHFLRMAHSSNQPIQMKSAVIYT